MIKSSSTQIDYIGQVPLDLRLDLQSAPLPKSISFAEVHKVLDSTNKRLREYFDKKRPPAPLLSNGLVGFVCADSQTAGRGRQARTWISPAGENIYSSFGFCLPDTLDLSGLSLVVGLAVRTALYATLSETKRAPNLRANESPCIQVKWPNDVLIDGAKIAGVLIEAFQHSGCWWVTIGIGINVNMTKLPATQVLDRAWTSLALISDQTYARGPLLSRLCTGLNAAVTAFQQQGWAAFANHWPAADWLYDQYLSVPSPLPDEPSRILTGQGKGVDSSGQLLLVDARGQTHRILSGEVSVQLSF